MHCAFNYKNTVAYAFEKILAMDVYKVNETEQSRMLNSPQKEQNSIHVLLKLPIMSPFILSRALPEDT